MVKILHNNLIIDLCHSVIYMKYLTEQQRFINVERYCANAILGSDHNTVYHLEGTPYTFPNKIKTVRAVEIDDIEYDKINSQLMLEKTEAEDLRKEVNDLKQMVSQQNDLILQLLQKLS